MRLGLGAVQFGLDYGVTNKSGRVSEGEVKQILAKAQENNIRVVDTAALYGDSEAVLGRCWPKGRRFDVVTKTPVFKKISINKEDAVALRNRFLASLDHLKLESVYGLLVHHADDIYSDGGNYLVDVLSELKANSLVQKIGVSVYTGPQIEKILEKFKPDIVQIPMNVFDQRLIRSGHLKQLKKLNIEIHARSIFLQGILLQDPVQKYFDPYRAHLSRYAKTLKEKGLTRMQGALAFINGLTEIDTAIAGVSSLKDFSEILDELKKSDQKIDAEGLAFEDEGLLNPATWGNI